MRYNLLIFSILIAVLTNVTAYAIDDKMKIDSTTSFMDKIRILYFTSVEEEEKLEELEELIGSKYILDLEKTPPLFLAYYAGIEAVKAKHAFWPFTKMNYLSTSMNIFTKAIEKDPANLEIRFMRYSILTYVPDISGYGDEEDDDKKMILKLLVENPNTEIDPDIQKGMAEFVIENGNLIDSDVEFLQNIYALNKL